MGENDGRESWAQVPGTPELWVSNTGLVATLKDGGGFDVLAPTMDEGGELVCSLGGAGPGGKGRGKRLVASLILHAFGQPHVGGKSVGYRDGNLENLRLENLCWVRKGQPIVGDLKPRRCLGPHCNHSTFLSTGDGNRLCATCNKLNGFKGSEAEGVHTPDEMPDAPSLYPPGLGKD